MEKFRNSKRGRPATGAWPQVAFKLPRPLLAQIDEHAGRTGQTRASLLRTAITSFLEQAAGRPAMSGAMRESIDVVTLYYPAMAGDPLFGTADSLPASFTVDGSAVYSLCSDPLGGALALASPAEAEQCIPRAVYIAGVAKVDVLNSQEIGRILREGGTSREDILEALAKSSGVARGDEAFATLYKAALGGDFAAIRSGRGAETRLLLEATGCGASGDRIRALHEIWRIRGEVARRLDYRAVDIQVSPQCKASLVLPGTVFKLVEDARALAQGE